MEKQHLGMMTLIRSAMKDEALTLPEDFDWHGAEKTLFEHHLVALAAWDVLYSIFRKIM